MKKGLGLYKLLNLLLVAVFLTGCAAPEGSQTSSIEVTEARDSTVETVETSSETDKTSSWNETTHGNDAKPDYSVVFPQDSVNRIDITLSAEAWTALQTEMTDQFGSQGQGQGFGNLGQMPAGPDTNGQQPNSPQNQQPPEGRPQGPGNFQPGGNGMGAMLNFGDTSYVQSTITFNGETWDSVGFRYSGNSTLQNSWRSGTQKISFRLDFDEFEEENPDIANQRFYGFKQISFKSNAMDSSYLREKVVADIFRDSGVTASQTAFYEVYVDFGEGPQYFGLYTAVEIVDDTVIETQFSDDSGNVYKPEGTGAAFIAGTFTEESFEKQTNASDADWSDIQAVFSALHSDLRTSDPAAWRAGLESVFDVDAFLHWLAVDTIIQNWDTYGAMAHNYYLYTDPEDGLVTWIPWDNNMALSAKTGGPGGGGGNRRGPGGGARELDLSTVTDQWPLIRFLIDDPVYLAKYNQYLEETIQGAFQPEKLAATYQKYHDLIAPFVLKETEGFTQLDSIESFNQSVTELVNHANNRYDAVVEYLNTK